jgi:hypothetical protein
MGAEPLMHGIIRITGAAALLAAATTLGACRAALS